VKDLKRFSTKPSPVASAGVAYSGTSSVVSSTSMWSSKQQSYSPEFLQRRLKSAKSCIKPVSGRTKSENSDEKLVNKIERTYVSSDASDVQQSRPETTVQPGVKVRNSGVITQPVVENQTQRVDAMSELEEENQPSPVPRKKSVNSSTIAPQGKRGKSCSTCFGCQREACGFCSQCSIGRKCGFQACENFTVGTLQNSKSAAKVGLETTRRPDGSSPLDADFDAMFGENGWVTRISNSDLKKKPRSRVGSSDVARAELSVSFQTAPITVGERVYCLWPDNQVCSFVRRPAGLLVSTCTQLRLFICRSGIGEKWSQKLEASRERSCSGFI
jgi:hypothetical protein